MVYLIVLVVTFPRSCMFLGWNNKQSKANDDAWDDNPAPKPKSVNKPSNDDEWDDEPASKPKQVKKASNDDEWDDEPSSNQNKG